MSPPVDSPPGSPAKPEPAKPDQASREQAISDYLPSPPIAAELILTQGQPLTPKSRLPYAYAFACLGGPLPPGFQGFLSWAGRTIPARLISQPGPQLVFETKAPFPLSESGGRALWRPAGQPFLPPSISPGVREWTRFQSPREGWLGAVNDLEPLSSTRSPDSPAPGWLSCPRELPLGVSFIWDRPVTEATLTETLAALPSSETLWVLGDQEDLLVFLAKTLQKAQRPVLALGPAQRPELAQVELGHLLDQKAAAKAAEMAQLEAQIDKLKARQRAAQAKLGQWRALRALEDDLARLGQEVASREVSWSLLAEELAAARADWAQSHPSRSWWSFLRKNKRAQTMSLARQRLETSEGEMARARREKADLLAEAQSLRAKVETASLAVRDWPTPQALTEEIQALTTESQELGSQLGELALAFSRTRAATDLWAQRPVALVFPGWAEPTHLADSGPVDNLVVLNPRGRTPAAREALAQLARWPVQRLVVVGDFTAWSWPGEPAEGETWPWASFLSQNLQDQAKKPKILAGPFAEEIFLAEPQPPKFPWLRELGLTKPISRWSWSGPWGPTWRAVEELGPFNPVSALAAVQLALAAHHLAPHEPINIVAPSRAQGAFLRALLQDLAPEAGNLAAGEPAELADWPPAALVIADTALGEEHPWAWPHEGRVALLAALGLAGGALGLVGDESVINRLPPESPLARLWNGAAPAQPAFRWPPLTSLTMWEALDQAQQEAFFSLPVFEPSWWAPLSIHFQAALNRRVKITVLAQTPPPDAQKYCDTVIRDLRLFGAQVTLAQGFADLVGLIDQRYFAWGWPGPGLGGPPGWRSLWALDLPRATPLVAQVAQAALIAKKLGPRGFRNCPQCGWPYILINQAKAQDFHHRQPLRLGCLNPNCPNHHQPRRLDERWPFLTPPICPQDKETRYVRRQKGRGEVWACPAPGHDCPRLKVIPGDLKPPK